MSLPTGEEIGALLRDWRKAERLSQEELAASAGVAQRTISYMEKGQSITLENLWRLLDYFGKGVEALSKEASRNAPEAPRTHHPPDPGTIPLAEHRAVVRAFLAQLEALERSVPRDLSPETLLRLNHDASGGDPEADPKPPDAPPRPGTRRRTSPASSRSGRRP